MAISLETKPESSTAPKIEMNQLLKYVGMY